MSDISVEPRAKRLRVDKGGRFAALEKLKQLKGSKNKCAVDEEVDHVYEVVDEKEYAKRAKERYGQDWIEEDGTGYAEDGRDFFEDEDEYSSEEETKESSTNKNQKKGSKKRPRDNDKPAKGKSSIRNLFSNAVPKKTAVTSIKDDNILADILGELDEKSNDSEQSILTGTSKVIAPAKIVQTSQSRKSDANLAKEYMNSFINNIKMKETEKKSEKTSDDELLDNIMKTKVKEEKKNIVKPKVQNNEENVKIPLKENNQSEDLTATIKKADTDIKDTVNEFGMDDELDLSCLEDAENQFELENETNVPPKNDNVKIAVTKPTEEEELAKLLNNWENICQMENFDEEKTTPAAVISVDDTSATLESENLRFWWWEAWEDSIKRPGELFLFGRTVDGKSICVHVQNIERTLYLLPRQYMLDSITKETTKQKVLLSDVYKEVDEDIANELKLEHFRSRKVTKSFANHNVGIDIPQLCDYVELRYDGKKPPPTMKRYNSIAHIFGGNTSSLERFLLDRKIRGPCWLTLKQFVSNKAPMSWCKCEVTVSDPQFVLHVDDVKAPPPPSLTLLTVNVRTAVDTKTMKNNICMISMLVHNRFHIDKPAPQPGFNRHMCGVTRPHQQNWPFDLTNKLTKYKSTRVYKHDTERALLSWFLAQYQQIDADLIVTHDALDCQLDVIVDRIVALKIPQWSRLGRLRMSQNFGRKLLDFYVGRMVCDVKHSAEECIRSRSYDLNTLCQNVLKIKEGERLDVNEEDLVEMYQTGDGILKLISLTMQDASYTLRLMYDLNIMPLALQITNICGNIMTRTLQGGRSERNEYLLLHAFTEKNYIVPDKKKRNWSNPTDDKKAMALTDDTYAEQTNNTTTSVAGGGGGARKKAAYSGGLVLDPVRGLYDKYILLMDFNSLYPSIIQEFNICFTTVQYPEAGEELPELPENNMEQGILPQQLRRLVESRREVKKLLTTPDLTPELHLQYHIRQMALKLTANSMYGCLGFSQSRFYAQHLAALVTHKGREILMNTKSLVQKMNYDVVYGDTDSIMVNTNIINYDQVYKIGHNIKQSVNKLYKQLELDIDGVFSCLLLLKKKKYAAVKVYKNAKGELKKEQEHKGLDIVRRDWSQLAIMVGKIVLDEVLSEKQLDEKLDAVHTHLERIKNEIENNAVPTTMFIITKQLSKAPKEFTKIITQPHVQVALRMNATKNRRYKKGDMVDYVICNDGTTNPPTQRAYHLDELKGNETLKLDANYYLAHQIHPVVTRMVEVLEGTDASRIAECLGLDPTKFRAAVQRSYEERLEETTGESINKTTLQKYRFCEKFKFICLTCKTENIVASAFRPGANHTYEPVLQKCANPECNTSPHQYIVYIRNGLVLTIRRYIERYYESWLVCDDPSCNLNTRNYTHITIGNRPICYQCCNGTFVRQYTERDLYNQLCYFQYMFDLNKQQQQQKNITLVPEVENAYHILRETVEQQLEKSAYCTISMAQLFSQFKPFEHNNGVNRKHIASATLDDE